MQLVGGIISPDVGYEAAKKKTEKGIKKAERDLKQAEDALAELDAERRLGTVDAKLFPTILRRLQEQRTEFQARLETLREGGRNLAQERKWVDWVAAFGDEVKLKGTLTPEQKRSYLSGMIERIDAKFLAHSKEHQLTIKFVKPIVGDGLIKQKPKGYKLRNSEQIKVVSLPMRGPPGKRLTPVGKHSITVE